MAAGGAVVAMLAAAHTQRLQAVTDAFRRAGATTPVRARSLADLGVAHAAEADELAKAGVLVAGPARDTWYLCEPAVVARRQAHARLNRRILRLALLLTAAMAVALGAWLATRYS